MIKKKEEKWQKKNSKNEFSEKKSSADLEKIKMLTNSENSQYQKLWNKNHNQSTQTPAVQQTYRQHQCYIETDVIFNETWIPQANTRACTMSSRNMVKFSRNFSATAINSVLFILHYTVFHIELNWACAKLFGPTIFEHCNKYTVLLSIS